jgi:hypothetical protein
MFGDAGTISLDSGVTFLVETSKPIGGSNTNTNSQSTITDHESRADKALTTCGLEISSIYRLTASRVHPQHNPSSSSIHKTPPSRGSQRSFAQLAISAQIAQDASSNQARSQPLWLGDHRLPFSLRELSPRQSICPDDQTRLRRRCVPRDRLCSNRVFRPRRQLRFLT